MKVHISSITDKFVSDPREIVKAGDIVKVKVLEVDAARKRISLTMRLDEQVEAQTSKPSLSKDKNNGKQDNNKTKNHESSRNNQGKPPAKQNNSQGKSKAKKVDNAAMGNAFADAFAKLKK